MQLNWAYMNRQKQFHNKLIQKYIGRGYRLYSVKAIIRFYESPLCSLKYFEWNKSNNVVVNGEFLSYNIRLFNRHDALHTRKKKTLGINNVSSFRFLYVKKKLCI